MTKVTTEGKFMIIVTLIIGIVGQIIIIPMLMGKVYPKDALIPYLGVLLVAGTAGCVLRIIFYFDKYFPDEQQNPNEVKHE